MSDSSLYVCSWDIATEAKTCGKYHHFQVKAFVFKGPATIMRSHRNRTCPLTGENKKGNCGKILHFIEHLNVRGEMRCNREGPWTQYLNPIHTTGAKWHLFVVIVPDQGIQMAPLQTYCFTDRRRLIGPQPKCLGEFHGRSPSIDEFFNRARS